MTDSSRLGPPVRGRGPLIGRRSLIGVAVSVPALALGAPALACRAAQPKDQAAYTAIIDRLFENWWRRDLPALRRLFQHGDVAQPFDPSRLFADHFTQPAAGRARAGILFNGSGAVVQTVTPSPPDPVMGICGGMAHGDLFAVEFWPGIHEPVVRNLTFVGFSVLAAGEWEGGTVS